MENITLTKEIISIEDWINISDCPIQRNTELHAKKARNNHLKTTALTHINVSAAKLPNGKVFKLDGHTRAYLWQDKSLIPDFSHVNVDMYSVNSLEEVKKLYMQFDNVNAAETSRDKLHGSYYLHHFHPKSHLLRQGAVTSAISLICRIHVNNSSNTIYTAISPYIDTLRLVDTQPFSRPKFPAGILAALIITTLLDGRDAFVFWRLFNEDGGIKEGKMKDAVQSLTDYLLFAKANKFNNRGGAVAISEYCARALAAYYGHKNNQTYVHVIKALDLNRFLKKHIKPIVETNNPSITMNLKNFRQDNANQARTN